MFIDLTPTLQYVDITGGHMCPFALQKCPSPGVACEMSVQLVSIGSKMTKDHRTGILSFYFMASNTNSSLWERDWQHESYACWASLNDGKEDVSWKWQHFNSFPPCKFRISLVELCPLISFHTATSQPRLSSTFCDKTTIFFIFYFQNH